MKHLVRIIHADGYKLEFPANGNAPMLFLEWIEEKQQHLTGRIAFGVTKETELLEAPIFVIGFDNIHRQDIEDCRDYIKSNI